MAEQTFFNRGGVTVTQARFMVPGQTYAMQGVTSIKTTVEEASKKGPIIAILIGAVVTLISFGIFSDSLGAGFVALVIGLGILGLGILWLKGLKDTHLVILSSASGESTALQSKDAAWVSEIVRALNDAIVERG